MKKLELNYEQQMARQISGDTEHSPRQIKGSELPLMDGPIPTELPVPGYAMEYLGYDVPERY